MLKKQYISVIIFGLSLVLLFVYQNCAEVGGNIDFASCQAGDQRCEGDPDQLFLNLNPGTLSNDLFTLPIYSSSGGSTQPNLNISGTCNTDNFSKVMVRAKIYECVGNNCTTLKYTTSSGCSPILDPNRFSISKSIQEPTLVPGRPHKIKLETYAINEFGQEVYGRNSRLPDKNMNVVRTIRPPNIVSRSLSINWSKPIVVISSSTNLIGLQTVEGDCDYSANTSEDRIYLNLYKPGSSVTPFEDIGSLTQCRSKIQTPPPSNLPLDPTRNGWFQKTIIQPTNLEFCISNGSNNCLLIEKYLNRTMDLVLYQKDITSNLTVNVTYTKTVAFKSTSDSYGKGWLTDVLMELGKRIKLAQNFTLYVGDESAVDGLEKIIDPIKYPTSVAGTDNTGETFSLRKWLLTFFADGLAYGENPGIDSSGTKYRIESANLQVFENIAVDPGGTLKIVGVSEAVSAPYNIELQNISLNLAYKFFYGLHAEYELAPKITSGLIYNGITCKFKSDNTDSPQKFCDKVLEYFKNPSDGLVFLQSKFIGSTQFTGAPENYKKRFVEAVIQMYINSIMREISSVSSNGQSVVFNLIMEYLYGNMIKTTPGYTLLSERNIFYRELYPAEKNYSTSSGNFSAYSEDSSPGSANTNGSIICVPNADRSQCN